MIRITSAKNSFCCCLSVCLKGGGGGGGGGGTLKKEEGKNDKSYTMTSLLRQVVVELLLYVHRNRMFIRDGSPGRPPRLSHSF